MESLDLRNLGEGLEGKGTLAAALAIAAGTQAYAVPIRYDNPAGPDHYQWDSFLGNNLDIRFGPTGQADVELGGITVNADFQYGSGYYIYTITQTTLGFGYGYYPYGYYAGFAQSSLFGGASFLRDGFYVLPVAPGADIGVAGQSFDFNNYIYADLSFYYYNTAYAGYSGLQSYLTPGLNYLGLRLTLDTARGLETHYGWLAVEVEQYYLFQYYAFGNLSMLAVTDAVAWGWETEPGVPIAAGAPAPGTLGALAFGAVAACGRGRRKKSA